MLWKLGSRFGSEKDAMEARNRSFGSVKDALEARKTLWKLGRRFGS
jgi:hypothetical protein